MLHLVGLMNRAGIKQVNSASAVTHTVIQMLVFLKNTS